MAAIATSGSLDEKIIEKLRTQAADGVDLDTMVRSVQDELGFSREFIMPTFAYFCKAFSLPLSEVLPLREWIQAKDDRQISSLLTAIKDQCHP